MAEKEISTLNMGGDDEGRTILVSGVPTDFRLEAIRSYFENKSRSNGGPIKGIPERIQDSGKVIITFESEKDAENVVQRKVHNINKFDLRVNWYKDLVWQEDAMIVSNGHKDMSEKMLIDLLEEKGKLDIVYVSPGRKPGTFLVYCQNEIDFEYVQKLCQKNPLKGNPLKVDTIEEINSVQVKTVSSNVSSESLESYFGNRKKSSGGDISSIRQETNGTYIVSFKEACVVLDVCRRRHQLEGVKLNVQPFWEPSEENTISKQQVFEYLLPSKFHLTFLKRHRIEVNDQLKKLAEVLWGDSKIDKLKFKNIEGNFEEIEQSLKDLLNSITVEIVDIPIDIFDDIVGTFNSEADQKYIYFDIRYCKAHILAFDKNNMIKMKNRLLDNLRIEHEDDLDIHERRILSGLRFFEQAERRFEELKVTVHSNKVIFEGHYSKAADCQKDMYKILRSIVKSELRLPFNTGMIINKEPVKEYLDEKLRDNNCIGSWEPGDGDSVLLYASDKTHLSDLEEVIKQSFVANTLDFVDKIKGTPNHGKWLTFVESLKTEFPDFCFIGEDSIVAVDEVINDIKSKIDNFEQSLTYESYISMNHAHFLFLKEFNEQEINDYGEKNKMKNVCLKDDKLHVEGTQEQIRKMETFIENLRKDISSKEVNFEMFGFQEFLESEEGKNFLCEMQSLSESIISLNSDLGSETDVANDRLEHMGGIAAAIVRKETASSNASLPGSQEEPSSMIPTTNVISGEYGGIEINLMIDSICNASLDVIVNSTNKNLQLNDGSISKYILLAAGPKIQDECNQKYPQGISTSEIAITKGYNLNCKNVFHLVLPPWDEDSSDLILANLTQIITNCLETAERIGVKSLAFPILGAGKLRYPIEKLPGIMYEAVKNYSNVNSSQIKVVNFVVYPQDTEIAKLFDEYLLNKQENERFHSKDDKDEEIEDNVSDGQQNVGVTLKFFTKNKNLDNAIETLQNKYHSLLTTEEIPFDMDLTQSRKLSLRNIGTRHKVQISIRDTITIHGRHCHVKDAKLSIQSLLMEFKETDEEIIFKDLAQWSYFEENSPGNLITFNDKENAKLEKAYSLGNRFLNYNKIKYDIKKMSFQYRGKKYKMKRKQNLKDEPIPDTWSSMGDKELIKIVPVTNGPEYDDIQTTFCRNLPSYRIIKIERIQNKTLYQGYQALKKKFEVENPNITNEVHGLWHGTAAESVNGINKSGFNRSYCGKNATAFGNGVYFARRIHYSANDKYSVPDHNGIKRMYKCSVLVGKMMQGSPDLKVLQDSYNSAVDNIQRPSIYVIYHDFQAYPNYLITFSILK